MRVRNESGMVITIHLPPFFSHRNLEPGEEVSLLEAYVACKECQDLLAKKWLVPVAPPLPPKEEKALEPVPEPKKKLRVRKAKKVEEPVEETPEESADDAKADD